MSGSPPGGSRSPPGRRRGTPGRASRRRRGRRPAFDGQQGGTDLGHGAAGVLDEEPQDLRVGHEASGFAGEERAAAHADAPPSRRLAFGSVVELALGIKGASLVLKGPGAVASRPGPACGDGSGEVRARPDGGLRWPELRPRPARKPTDARAMSVPFTRGSGGRQGARAVNARSADLGGLGSVLVGLVLGVASGAVGRRFESCRGHHPLQHPNLWLLVAGPTIRLGSRHAKVRRGGYRKPEPS